MTGVPNLYASVVMDEAQEIVTRLLDPGLDGDGIADLLEHAMDKTDRAHAVLLYMTLRARGVAEFNPAVRDANASGAGGKLVIP